MEVALLWWAGCPSHPVVADQLRALGVEFVEREIVSEEDAARERFPGSPTIRVDGADLFPTDEPPGADVPDLPPRGRPVLPHARP